MAVGLAQIRLSLSAVESEGDSRDLGGQVGLDLVGDGLRIGRDSVDDP